MTIPVTERIAGPFSCNGSVVDFDFAFKVFLTTDIRVVLTASMGAADDLVMTSEYTVALNADQTANPGGTVTTLTAFPVGYSITIDGSLAYSQTAELTNLGGFFPKVIERALDRLAIQSQQLKRLTDRSIKIPVVDGLLTVEVPIASVRANKFLSFDSLGNVTATADVGGSTTAAAASAAAALASQTAAANSAIAAGVSATASADSAVTAATSEAAAAVSAAAAANASPVPLMDLGGMNFNGTTTYLDTNALTGIADGKKGSFMWHGRFANAASATEIIHDATNSRFRVSRTATGNIAVLGLNAATTTILSKTANAMPCAAAGVYKILVSWDLAVPGSYKIYINDVAAATSTGTFTDDSIDYTTTEHSIGGGATGTAFFAGDMYSYWFDPTSALDFSTESVRRKFFSASGVQVPLGRNGELPTGTAPILFLAYGPYTSWSSNRGTATTAFTENGAPAAPATVGYGLYFETHVNGLGYVKGQGGAVIQATSKSTGVTINKKSGNITMNAASLAADTTASFTVTNTQIAADDVLILNHISGGTPGSYNLNARCAAGSAVIDVRNITAAPLLEAIVIKYVIVKGSSV